MTLAELVRLLTLDALRAEIRLDLYLRFMPLYFQAWPARKRKRRRP